MARKRMIDPSIWTDEGMAELTARQQLLYVGLFSNADDDGRLKGSGAALKLILPTLYADVPAGEVEVDVSAVLDAMHQLVRYVYDGRAYIAFRNYRQWQKIEKPTPSILPAPPDDSPTAPRSVPDDSPTAPIGVAPNRKEGKGSEEKGTEEKGEGADAPPPARSTVRPVPKPKETERDPALDHPAVMLYREICRHTANREQRAAIAGQVDNLDRWRDTLQQWQLKGWKPTNVAGMLDHYAKGPPVSVNGHEVDPKLARTIRGLQMITE